MKPVELLPGVQVEGCLIEVLCGCLVMRTWAMKRITYHTSARIPLLFGKKEGHHIIFRVNEFGTELELIRSYGKCSL